VKNDGYPSRLSEYSTSGYYPKDSYLHYSTHPFSPQNQLFSPSNEESESYSPSISGTGEVINLSSGKKLGFGFSAQPNTTKRPRLVIAPGFNAEEEAQIQPKKKLILVPLEYDDDKSGYSITGSPLTSSSNSEKKKYIQQQKKSNRKDTNCYS